MRRGGRGTPEEGGRLLTALSGRAGQGPERPDVCGTLPAHNDSGALRAGPCSALGAALGKPRPAGMGGCDFSGAERSATSG